MLVTVFVKCNSNFSLKLFQTKKQSVFNHDNPELKQCKRQLHLLLTLSKHRPNPNIKTAYTGGPIVHQKIS